MTFGDAPAAACGAGSNFIWYRYTAGTTGLATALTCGSGYDTVVEVFDDTGCPPSGGDLLGCNDDFCGLQSQVTWNAVAGNDYLIRVGGFGGGTGTGTLTVTQEGQQSATAVPALSGMGLALAALALLGVGFALQQRRQRPTIVEAPR